VLCWLQAGLVDRRIEAKVADQFLRRAKASDIADGRDQPDRNRGVDAGDGQQLAQPVVPNSGLGQDALNLLQILCQPVELMQPLIDPDALVHG